MKKIFWFLIAYLFVSTTLTADIISYDNKLTSNGKNVLLILGSKNCPYCDALKKDINNDRLKNLIKDKMNVYYVPVDEQVNVEMGDKNPPVKTTSLSLKMQFGSRVTPTIVIFDKDWKRIIQLPGYADPNQMSVFIKYVNENIYKNKDLGEYLKEEGIL
ncbi:thioredoxin family protein [Sulfurospirillum sp. 1307]|jgi:thioredoxin-related protein